MIKTDRMSQLAGLCESKWVDNVQTKKHPPEGLFANGTSATIIKWLKDNHKDYKSASASLNFYINRSGKNLIDSRKKELESIKGALKKAYSVTEEMNQLRRMAGLPTLPLFEDSEINDDETAEEETEESTEEKPEETSEKVDDPAEEKTVHHYLMKIAKTVEGKSLEEITDILGNVYDAGYKDGGAVETTPEEKPEAEESDNQAVEDDK